MVCPASVIIVRYGVCIYSWRNWKEMALLILLSHNPVHLTGKYHYNLYKACLITTKCLFQWMNTSQLVCVAVLSPRFEALHGRVWCPIVIPRRACTAKVTVLGCVCVCVCVRLSVCYCYTATPGYKAAKRTIPMA